MKYLIGDLLLVQKIEQATNEEVLSDQERDRARSMLSDMEAEFSRLAQDVSQSITEREGLGKAIPKFRLALAPHKRLPTEVLSQIFVYAAVAESITFPPLLKRVPWVLRNVCSKWRRVALNEIRLWNRFTVYANPVTARWYSKFIPILRNVLPPAGLLSITLKQQEDPDSSPIAVIDTLIVPNLSRAKELDLAISQSSLQHLITTQSDSLIPLESLSLDLLKVDDVDELRHQCANSVIFRNARNIRRLELGSLPSPPVVDIMTNFPLPWNQLTSLIIMSLRPFSLVDLRRVLHGCHSLQNLQARFRYASHTPPADPYDGPILPDLRYVELHGEIMRGDSLMSLSLPWKQLRSLKLKYLRGSCQSIEPYNILRNCAQIEELSLILQNGSSPLPGSQTGMFTFSRLTTLDLDISETLILENLIVPALTSLQLHSGISGPSPLIHASNMILRSGCSLSSFSYHAWSKNGDLQALHRFLTLVPSANELKFDVVLVLPYCKQPPSYSSWKV
ncbi:hypothetical protein FPV67DRAFT_1450656 [Lyophyllum atratum]|nr:hypothetical protein FPV67DRAFT_1450656 [Lyophyllum atratum]